MGIKIGIDIGGVLRTKLESSKDSIEAYLAAPASKHSLETVKQIVNIYGVENIFIVSKCPLDKETMLMLWLEQHGFVGPKLLQNDHVYFCRERSDKATVAKQLGITYFIDDRAEVLEHMRGIVEKRILLSMDKDAINTNDKSIVVFNDWLSIKQDLLN